MTALEKLMIALALLALVGLALTDPVVIHALEVLS